MWWHTRRNQISSFGETDESIEISGGRQFSRLLAAEVCESAVVMLDTPCSEVVWRVLATHSIRQFPLQFPSRASPCTITFQLESTVRSTDAYEGAKSMYGGMTGEHGFFTRRGWKVLCSPPCIFRLLPCSLWSGGGGAVLGKTATTPALPNTCTSYTA